MSNHLPGLIFRPGITRWTPAVDRSVTMDFKTYDDFIKTIAESQRADVRMLPSHWPPSPAEVDSLHLERWYVEFKALRQGYVD